MQEEDSVRACYVDASGFATPLEKLAPANSRDHPLALLESTHGPRVRYTPSRIILDPNFIDVQATQERRTVAET